MCKSYESITINSSDKKTKIKHVNRFCNSLEYLINGVEIEEQVPCICSPEYKEQDGFQSKNGIVIRNCTVDSDDIHIYKGAVISLTVIILIFAIIIIALATTLKYKTQHAAIVIPYSYHDSQQSEVEPLVERRPNASKNRKSMVVSNRNGLLPSKRHSKNHLTLPEEDA